MDFCPLRRHRLFSRVFIPIRILQWRAITHSLKPSSIFLVNTKPLTQYDMHYLFWEKAWSNIKCQSKLGTTTTQKLTKLDGKGLTSVTVPGHFPLPLINWQITLFPHLQPPLYKLCSKEVLMNDIMAPTATPLLGRVNSHWKPLGGQWISVTPAQIRHNSILRCRCPNAIKQLIITF